MQVRLAIALGLGLAMASCACVQARVPTVPAHEIDMLFAAHAQDEGPGYVIGIIRSGELVFARGFGLADVARRVPLTSDTPMNLASLSKQFTAAAVALEIERGNLAPDDPLSRHWPGLPRFMDGVTIAHLVHMSSGVPEYFRLRPRVHGWGPEDGFTVDEALAAVFDAGKLDFAPGSRWAYCNSNYMLLAEFVARINGRSFADHMQRTLFEPLGMRDTWVDAPESKSRLGRALAYVRDRDSSWRVASRISRHYGGSGMFASLRDLARWDAALYHSDILGTGFRSRMLSTRKFGHGKADDAFGLVHGSERGHATLWYEGGDHGVSTYMIRFPRREETIVCLSNVGDGNCAGKVRQITNVLLRDTPTAAQRPTPHETP